MKYQILSFFLIFSIKVQSQNFLPKLITTSNWNQLIVKKRGDSTLELALKATFNLKGKVTHLHMGNHWRNKVLDQYFFYDKKGELTKCIMPHNTHDNNEEVMVYEYAKKKGKVYLISNSTHAVHPIIDSIVIRPVLRETTLIGNQKSTYQAKSTTFELYEIFADEILERYEGTRDSIVYDSLGRISKVLHVTEPGFELDSAGREIEVYSGYSYSYNKDGLLISRTFTIGSFTYTNWQYIYSHNKLLRIEEIQKDKIKKVWYFSYL